MYRWFDKRYNWHLCYIRYLTHITVYMIHNMDSRLTDIKIYIQHILVPHVKLLIHLKWWCLYIYNVTLEIRKK